MESRVSLYLGLVNAIQTDQLETSSLLDLKMFNGVFAVIDVGLQQIQYALDACDLQRCEIEAEHIHNLPLLIDTTRNQSFVYYLEKERDYYLSRLEELYGGEVRASVEKSLQEKWSLMNSGL